MLVLKINVAAPPFPDELLPRHEAILHGIGIQFDFFSRRRIHKRPDNFQEDADEERDVDQESDAHAFRVVVLKGVEESARHAHGWILLFIGIVGQDGNVSEVRAPVISQAKREGGGR